MKSTRSTASRRDLSVVAPIPATPPGHDDAPADSTPAASAEPPEPGWEERVRDAAYRRYQQRGERSGDAVTDWLEAEAELQAQRAAAPEPAQRH